MVGSEAALVGQRSVLSGADSTIAGWMVGSVDATQSCALVSGARRTKASAAGDLRMWCWARRGSRAGRRPSRWDWRLTGPEETRARRHAPLVEAPCVFVGLTRHLQAG